MTADDVRVHHELVIMLNFEDWKLSRQEQRKKAADLGEVEMRRRGLVPAMRTMPHAERLRDGVWMVQGWWLPLNGQSPAQGSLEPPGRNNRHT